MPTVLGIITYGRTVLLFMFAITVVPMEKCTSAEQLKDWRTIVHGQEARLEVSILRSRTINVRHRLMGFVL